MDSITIAAYSHIWIETVDTILCLHPSKSNTVKKFKKLLVEQWNILSFMQYLILDLSDHNLFENYDLNFNFNINRLEFNLENTLFLEYVNKYRDFYLVTSSSTKIDFKRLLLDFMNQRGQFSSAYCKWVAQYLMYLFIYSLSFSVQKLQSEIIFSIDLKTIFENFSFEDDSKSSELISFTSSPLLEISKHIHSINPKTIFVSKSSIDHLPKSFRDYTNSIWFKLVIFRYIHELSHNFQPKMIVMEKSELKNDIFKLNIFNKTRIVLI